MKNETHKIATWVQQLTYDSIPEECIRKAKEQLSNVVGAIMMSVDAPANKAVVDSVREYDGNARSTIFGTPYRVSPGSAAIANSFAAQLFEFEDWVQASHAGASVVPTAMAMAEAVGSSGKELLTAIVIGNEFAGRTGRAILQGGYVGNSLPNHQVDTALIAGKLLGLEVDQLQSAVGLSCFMAMESCPVGFLTDAKGLINSWPAYTGIMSAVMAKNGVVGNKDIIEHPAGYLHTVSEAVKLSELTDGLGEVWVLPTLRSKPFPICGYNIASIEAALCLVRENDLHPEQIESVDVYATGATLFAGTRFHALQPDIYQQIKNGSATHIPLLFDVAFPMAAAIFDRELTPTQFDEAHIFNESIQGLARKIALHTDAELHDAYYREFKFGSRVEIQLKNGARLSKLVPEMPGAPSNPFDVVKKFNRGAVPVIGQEQATAAAQILQSLESIPNIEVLAQALRVQ